MKKLFICIIITFTFLGCATISRSKVIPYILSIEAENSIYQKIKDYDKNKIAFYFERIEKNKNRIHLLKDGINDKYSFSNRKLFINDRFYPLIFDNDDNFYVEMVNNFPVVFKFEDETEMKSNKFKMPNIEERIKNKNLYIKSMIKRLIEISTNWVVDDNGKLIETN